MFVQVAFIIAVKCFPRSKTSRCVSRGGRPALDKHTLFAQLCCLRASRPPSRGCRHQFKSPCCPF